MTLFHPSVSRHNVGCVMVFKGGQVVIVEPSELTSLSNYSIYFGKIYDRIIDF